ncbi:MAG: hypothetical protein HRT41_05365 [Campylobacteraceae bacterium]|nr:hypothetical protein [Campylobacteraceae bacterium]
MKCKTIYGLKHLLLVLIFFTHIEAKDKQYLEYILQSEGKIIGKMTIVEKENELITKMTINISSVFFTYFYTYIEKSFYKNKELVSFEIMENDDGKIKKIKALKKGNHLVYSNETILDIKGIDVSAFKINKEFLARNIGKKSFTIKTYDAFEAKKLQVHYTLKNKNNKSYTFEVLNSRKEKELRVYTKNAVLIYFENDFFQASLLKKEEYK